MRLKFISIFLIVLCAITIYAGSLDNSDFSIADTDNFAAPLVNPAAMEIGNSNGFTFIQAFNEDEFEKDYMYMFNFDGFDYTFRDNHNLSYHNLASSFDLGRNLYMGFGYNWLNSKFKDGNSKLSVLYRPYNFLSTAASWDDISEEYESLNMGVAIRPIPRDGSFWNRVTLASDIQYTNEEFLDPTFFIQTELLDGFSLGGSYVMEDETFNVNFSLSFGRTKIGSFSKFESNNDNNMKKGYYYVNFSNRKLRSLQFKKKSSRFYNYKLSGEIVEKQPSFTVGPFRIVTGKGKTIEEIKRTLNELKEFDEISGIVFKSGNISASLANYNELRDALLDYKSAGKKIIFYYESISNMNYALVANVADKIYLNPMGSVNLKGFAAKVPYFKGLLDTIGVDVVNFRSHEYKTAGNMFSEAEMTESEREAYDVLLQDIYEEMISMISAGRKNKLLKPVSEIIDNGPYMIAEEALEEGLVDELIYEDELNNRLKTDFYSNKIVDSYERNFYKYDWSEKKKCNIALIHAIGSIHSGKGVDGKSIGSKSLAALIKSARENKDIEGIILRVDSGGGSALASDIIAREVRLCKTGVNAKPVVVSMSGAAASGGYYISCQADKIIAQPTTITGSIGVVGIIPNFERLYKKLFINWSTVKKGEHSDILSTSRKMTDTEKTLFEKSIENVYWKFVNIVAKGRELSRDEVHEVAQGRVWTGKQAIKFGLVDELGGMDVAIDSMKELVKTDLELQLIHYPQKDNRLTITMESEFPFAFLPGMKTTQKLLELYEKYDVLEKFDGEEVLMLSPVDSSILAE